MVQGGGVALTCGRELLWGNFLQRPFLEFKCTIDNSLFVSLTYIVCPNFTIQHLTIKIWNSQVEQCTTQDENQSKLRPDELTLEIKRYLYYHTLSPPWVTCWCFPWSYHFLKSHQRVGSTCARWAIMRGANQGTPPSLSHPADMATMLRQSTPEKIDANSSMSLNVNPSPICGHRHCRGVAWRTTAGNPCPWTRTIEGGRGGMGAWCTIDSKSRRAQAGWVNHLFYTHALTWAGPHQTCNNCLRYSRYMSFPLNENQQNTFTTVVFWKEIFKLCIKCSIKINA